VQERSTALLFVQNVIDGDAVCPSFQPPPEINCDKRVISRDQNFLRCIFRVPAIAQHTQDKPSMSPQVSDQVVERTPISSERRSSGILKRGNARLFFLSHSNRPIATIA
jgi:hypothetical protein